MLVPEQTLTLDLLPLSADTARLVRVYGTEPCLALPGTLPAPKGGRFAVTELGDYCFSEKPRSLPATDALCRYEVAPDGTVRLTRAFGQKLDGSSGRYDLDFGTSAEPDELHPVCGNFLEELTLPDSLRVIGSCAFYNCRKLRLLTVGAENLTMGLLYRSLFFFTAGPDRRTAHRTAQDRKTYRNTNCCNHCHIHRLF